jgi:hypothetical protein
MTVCMPRYNDMQNSDQQSIVKSQLSLARSVQLFPAGTLSHDLIIDSSELLRCELPISLAREG